jgi:hypothetical protein
MGGLRISNEVILAKTESSYGLDPTPVVATNSILVRNVSMSAEGLRMNARAAIRGSIGQLQDVWGGQLARITFEVEMKGSGTAGTAPEVGPLIEACGFEETIVAVTSVTYKPESDAHESVTIYYFEGGRKRHILRGCRGTVTFKLEAGGIMLATFELVGHHDEPTDQTQPIPVYNAQVPKAGLGMAVAVNGVSAIVARSWEWMANNVIATPPSLAAVDGYGDVAITGRDVGGSIVLETELDSVIDHDLLWRAGTRFAFTSGTLGSTAGNRIVVSTPSSSTYVRNSEMQDGEGLRLRNITYGVDDSTANQELSIAFT